MRNSFLLVCSLLGAAVVAVAACSDVASGLSPSQSNTPTASGDGTPGSVAADGGSTTDMPLAVSRLCSTNPQCLPDDDGTFTPTSGISTCATPYDGGTGYARYDNGCRVGDAGPSCLDGGADREGTDGVSCKSGADCAPGFDCIVSSTNRGSVCRRYCCAGSSACVDHPSQNGGETFCDVQQLAATGAIVPVCVPIKQCTLLKAHECNADETCAIVTDKGETGCVAVGTAKVDEPCDEVHCAAGLACLGTAGNRKCYALCRTADAGTDVCESGKKCTTGSLFPDTSYGACR